MTFVYIIAAIVAVLIVLALGRFLLECANRHPQVGAFSLFAWLGVFVLGIENPDLFQRNIGGINIVLPDLLCAFLAVLAALRFIKQPPVISRGFLVPLALVVGLLLLSYVRGVLDFGLQRATNEFREFFYFLSALLFTVSFPAVRLAERIPPVAMLGGAFLCVVAIARIPLMGGFGLEERSVPSYVALAMGQAFFFGWAWVGAKEKSTAWRWAVFGFILFSFLMLHRSVWMAVAVGLTALLCLDRSHRKGLFAALLAGGFAAVIGIGLFAGDKVLAGLNQAVTEATASEGSTFMWRLEGWLALLRPDAGWSVSNLLIGNPMGSGYARSLGNSALNTSDIGSGIIPHNYYVSMILRGGIIGVLALIGLYIALVKSFLRHRLQPGAHAYCACFVAILSTQLIYYIPYSADMIQGIFLGASVAVASTFCVARLPAPLSV